MRQTQRIADSYRAATVKGAWYGPSLAELLAQISPELATTRPVPVCHSISELLQHLLLWNERIRNTSESNSLPPWEPEKDWAGGADSVERTGLQMEPKSRAARREDSEFSDRGSGETGSWA